MIDEHGEGLLTDLRFYYGIDLVETVRGRGEPPSLVLWYVRRLPDTSLTHALRSGGWEHFGWGQDRHLTADLYDALSFNTRTTWAVAGGKPPDFPMWPRPKPNSNQSDDPEVKRKKFSVKALWHRMNARAATQGGE